VLPNVPETPWHFDHASGMRIRLRIQKNQTGFPWGAVKPMYRGVPLRESVSGLVSVGADIDILKGAADELLTLNREEFAAGVEAQVQKDAVKAMCRIVAVTLERSRSSQELTPQYMTSLSLALLLSDSEESKVAGSEWRRYQAVKEFTLGELCGVPLVRLVRAYKAFDQPAETEVSPTQELITVTCFNEQARDIFAEVLWRNDYHRAVIDFGCPRESGGSPEIWEFSKERPSSFYGSDAILHSVLVRASRPAHSGCRRTIPIIKGFDALALAGDLNAGYAAKIEPEATPRLLLPFAFSHDGTTLKDLPTVVSYLENHLSQKLSRAEIAEHVMRLIEFIDSRMDQESEWTQRQQYSVQEARRLLGMVGGTT
jgi:hypothetical protein